MTVVHFTEKSTTVYPMIRPILPSDDDDTSSGYVVYLVSYVMAVFVRQ